MSAKRSTTTKPPAARSPKSRPAGTEQKTRARTQPPAKKRPTSGTAQKPRSDSTVVAAVKRDLDEIARGDRSLAESGLAASALVLAAQLDEPGNSATAKSMCARALREALDRLRELAPKAAEGDRLDDLAARRAKRRAAAARRKRS